MFIPGWCSWRGAITATFVFARPERGSEFTYAVVDCGEDFTRGVNVGNALPWGGATPTSKPFSNSEFAVDSDVAYKAATGMAAAWLKKHPAMKAPTFRLGNASRFPAPVWYTMWVTQKNGYAALINATTGTPIK